MKNLEFNQMENLSGGQTMNYGDLTCEEFWFGASTAIGGASFYAAAIFGPVGGVVGFLASTAASAYGTYGC